jgi:hypothetical protein
MADGFFEFAGHFWPFAVGFAHKLFAFHIATSSTRLLGSHHAETGRGRFQVASEGRDCARRSRQIGGRDGNYENA